MGRWRFAARRGVALWLALLTSTFVFPAHLGSAGTTGWGTPELLATADLPIDEYGNVGTLTSPQISMRPEGSAVAMWWQADGDRSNIWAAHFIESRWTAPEAIGTGGSYDWLDVAVDPTGAALAVWANSSSSESGDIEHTVYASRFAPGAGWGVPTKVGTGWGPQVAVDSEGNALVVWTELLLDQPGFYGEKQRVWANRFVPRSGWGLPTLIEAERGGLADIAIDAWGNAVVGWWCEDECASANTHLPMVSRYTPEEGWEAPTVLEGRSHRVQVAMRSDGTAVALWALGTAPLRVSRYVPATGWETSTELVGAGAAEVVTAPYDVAAGGEGTAIAAWSFGSVTQPTWSEPEQDPYYNRQVYASRFAPEVGWQVATALSKETGAVVVRDVRSVAMDPEGDGVVVWTEHDGARTSVWASHYARGRGWGDSETISEALPAVDSWVKHYWQMSAEVAMDREGRAIAIWSQSSGNRTEVWASRYIPPPPWESDLLSLDAKVLVLVAANVVLAVGLTVLFVSHRTLRKRVRPREEIAAEGHNPDHRERGNRLVSKRTASHRGGAASPPGWRRWPANNAALRLTAKERILLHLLDFARHSNTTEFPPELTSTGIAMAVGIDGRHVAQYLRPLVKEGLVLEKTARVRGALQRRKVYVLDAEGWRSATGIRERVLFLTVRVRDESGDRQATVAEILAATHGHRKLLDVVREATEVGFVALSAR